MKNQLLALLIAPFLIWSCTETSSTQSEKTEESKTETSIPTFQNKAHELVYNMTEKVGNYQKLRALNDVVYTYTYQTPDGKEDIVTEKYIFDGENSYALYNKHERTLADLEGEFEQGYDGTTFWLKHNGVYIEDEAPMKRVRFNRKTNFYWFTMMQKLMDDGLNYKYVSDTTVNDIAYHVVDISFNSENDKPTDTYRLFINKETELVDQFLFTVADFGVMDEPRLMQVEYEEINGFLIPTKRQYKKSNWNAEVSADPWIYVKWTDIKFNNGLDRALFKKKA